MVKKMDAGRHGVLKTGTVIPAHPLALNADRRLDERRQRAVSRYYVAAGAGGIAIGVHTTQFAIREPHVGLFEAVFALAAEEMGCPGPVWRVPPVRIRRGFGRTVRTRK